jgi:hypothetical protein
MSRRSARSQELPKTEAQFLATLKGERLHIRVAQLYSVGWTYQAIGNALDPQRPRSTIKSWADKYPTETNAIDVPIDFPRLRTPEGGYQRKTPVSPGVSTDVAMELQRLAPLAREYRSGMGPSSLQGQANDQFDALIRKLKDSDVSIADIARAANVTHRAIARRLKKE